MPSRRLVPVLLAAALLAGCTGTDTSEPRLLPPGPTHRDDRADGWHRVEVDGTVRAIAALNSEDPAAHLTAGGDRRGGPLLVDVTDGRVLDLSARVPAHVPLDAVGSNGETVQATAGSTTWSGVALPGADEPLTVEPVPAGTAWLTPLLDGEENVRLVGPVDGRLHAWHHDGTRYVRSDRTGLPVGPSGRLVVDVTEWGVLVAVGPALWWADDPVDGPPQPWHREPLSPAPDAVTDVHCWDVGCWAVGVRHGAPVGWDIDDRDFNPFDMPPAHLDPAHPTVLLAEHPGWSPFVLVATQDRDGPVLWRSERDGTWTRTRAPAGRLTAARRVGGGVYLLIDGRLWYRTVPAVGNT